MRSEFSLWDCALFGTSEAIEMITDKVISELRGLGEWGYIYIYKSTCQYLSV